MKEKYEIRERRHAIRYLLWAISWTVCHAVTTFGGKLWWPEVLWLKVATIAFTLLVGVGLVWDFKRMLGEIDELMRRIQVNALSLSSGLGIVVGLAYSSLDQLNVIGGDAEIGHLVIFMCLTYIAAIVSATRHYR